MQIIVANPRAYLTANVHTQPYYPLENYASQELYLFLPLHCYRYSREVTSLKLLYFSAF